jgi:predicted kinase
VPATVPDRPPAEVVVLVGASGSGKTTMRRCLVAAGWPADLVVSLDDLRRCARDHDLARGRHPRTLQDYSALAARQAARRSDAFAAFGTGYLADATHLRRRDRRVHVRTATDAGLRARALLTPVLPLAVLLERNARRPPDEVVPVDVLARQAHRRSLITAGSLAEEGFSAIHLL